MKCKLHIISLNKEFVQLATARFYGKALVEMRDILDVEREGRIFVSPANSLGFMDGGIDIPLSRTMFPGCERVVRSAIASLGYKTALGRAYLRVGSALSVHVGPSTALISAPTMFLPHDVSETQNAYWAFMAILMLAERLYYSSSRSLHTIVCPSLCCGYGRMPAAVAVEQMWNALEDFEAGRRPVEVEDRGSSYMLLPDHDIEQSANYDNREIGVGAFADEKIIRFSR
jgi:O-acetyl-ADP-ribose deacetylase (regulator of RNase III)